MAQKWLVGFSLLWLAAGARKAAICDSKSSSSATRKAAHLRPERQIVSTRKTARLDQKNQLICDSKSSSSATRKTDRLDQKCSSCATRNRPLYCRGDPRHGAALVPEAKFSKQSAGKNRICGLCVYECASSACNPILEKRNEELSHVCRVRTNTVK